MRSQSGAPAQPVRTSAAGLDAVLARVLGDGTVTERRVLMRFIPQVMVLSAVANNTPIVAVGAPVLRSWAERHGVAATRLLMPLSFATILGGSRCIIRSRHTSEIVNPIRLTIVPSRGHPVRLVL